jgi:2-C-methyl-D-erythritol 4-phosphate cytidylyltransferase / 2-C-methyl-D-erythritol 2,4-cyclodiphosphate synthase
VKVSVIVVAAGAGLRFGYIRNKLFYPLCGRPVLAHTLGHVFAAKCVDEVVLVTSIEDRADIQKMVSLFHPSVPVRYADGGVERQESVYHGLLACSPSTDIVMVHDGARPWAGPDWFDKGLAAMKNAKAAVYAISVKDTIKEKDDETSAAAKLHTLERSRLIAVQTPQMFHHSTLLSAYEYAKENNLSATDDASFVEALGEPVVILSGDERNRKVTTKEDIPVLEFYMRGASVPHVGCGYDVHPLVEGRKLVLGGVTIPFEKGLAGHSDADVLIHAVMDALLGAAGLKDIGTYFPDSSQEFKDISSLLLLERVWHILQNKGCRIVNIDVILLAQRPKIKEYIDKMAANIAAALHIPVSVVAVKATTTEHLGFIGREEGMAAQASAMVVVPENE